MFIVLMLSTGLDIAEVVGPFERYKTAEQHLSTLMEVAQHDLRLACTIDPSRHGRSHRRVACAGNPEDSMVVFDLLETINVSTARTQFKEPDSLK